MSDSLSFLRKANAQSLDELVQALIRRVNQLENTFNRTNTGLNVTEPTMPASNIDVVWTGKKPATVYIWGGTVTLITITSGLGYGVVSPGFTSGTFRIVPGDSIKIVYSVAPTWRWYGD